MSQRHRRRHWRARRGEAAGRSARAERPPSDAESPWHADRERRDAIARLLPLWPHELGDASEAGRLNILAKLRSALRAERRRGIAGHWSYDLARHVELLRAYKKELAAQGSDPSRCGR